MCNCTLPLIGGLVAGGSAIIGGSPGGAVTGGSAYVTTDAGRLLVAGTACNCADYYPLFEGTGCSCRRRIVGGLSAGGRAVVGGGPGGLIANGAAYVTTDPGPARLAGVACTCIEYHPTTAGGAVVGGAALVGVQGGGTGGGGGDPHFMGLDGLAFDYHGRHNRFYCLVYDRSVQVNALFTKFRDHLTYMTKMGFVLNGEGTSRVGFFADGSVEVCGTSPIVRRVTDPRLASKIDIIAKSTTLWCLM